MIARLSKIFTAALVAALLSACGGGGGDANDIASHPAPQTMNALVLNLWASGPRLTFIRAGGNAVTGTETGGFLYEPGAQPSTLADGNEVTPPFDVVGASYEYQKTGPETGTLTIRGTENVPLTIIPAPDAATYMAGADFERILDITFITDGSIVTSLNIDDTSGAPITTNPTWLSAFISQYPTGSVPVGYSLDYSETQQLPYLYPSSIDGETMETTPITNGGDGDLLGLQYIFTVSSFPASEYTGSVSDYDEIGNVRIADKTAPTIALDFASGPSFIYKKDVNTTDEATIRIYGTSIPDYAVTYRLTFTSKNSGTYVIDSAGTATYNGDSGTFQFTSITSG